MNTKVLVTGANGQLGQSILYLKDNFSDLEFLFCNSSDLDITNQIQVQDFFNKNKIDWCINCAAYTAVDNAENEQDAAYNVNVLGAKNIAVACKKHKVTLIHISTDFVFNGEKKTPYSETDSTNPQTIYGRTKLEGEQEIINNINNHFIFRTSWLYSSFGHNFLKTMLRLSMTNKKLSVVNDQEGSPTHALDLAKMILNIIRDGNSNYGLYHFSNQGEISWYTFAKTIFELTNTNIVLESITTEGFPTLAKRPQYSVLDTSKIKNTLNVEIPHWKDSLEEVITILMDKNLQIAIQASLQAGAAIMDIYDTAFDVEYKDDKSPLTSADKKANDIINSYLLPTEIPIISEENKQIDYSTRKEWSTSWIVDPVDGTKEFIKRNGEFTVNIALVGNGKPLLGVIYVPVSKTLYFANVVKKEAFKVDLQSHETMLDDVFKNAIKLKPETSQNKTRIVGSRSHMNIETQDFVDSLKKSGKEVEIVSKGSSLKFCLIAEGKADIYPRFAPTMEWDTAAGQAICNAVGINVISNETQKSLLYNKENLLNPWFLVSK